MLSFPLAQQFRARAQAALPSPRAALAALAARGIGLRGAFVPLGAIAVGAALMTANIVHERRAAAVAAAPAAAPTIQAVALVPPTVEPKPDPIAAVATAPAVAPTPEKAAVDTMPTGAIADPVKPKLKHKHHPKKSVDANP